MNLECAFLNTLVLEINQYFGLNLRLKNNQSCAFIDQHGLYFQLRAVSPGVVILSADLCRVMPHQKEVLLDALSLNGRLNGSGNLLLKGAFVGLAPDKTTLLLIRELTEAHLSNKKPEQWLSSFIMTARSISHRLESCEMEPYT